MSTPVEYQKVCAELAQLRTAIEALADDLREYNPGFGDYARAGLLIRALLDEGRAS